MERTIYVLYHIKNYHYHQLNNGTVEILRMMEVTEVNGYGIDKVNLYVRLIIIGNTEKAEMNV